MTTQLEQDVALAEYHGFIKPTALKNQRICYTDQIHAFANAVREQSVPQLEPTKEMIEAGAKRLMSWEDDSVWPDSWTPLQVAGARNEAERVWRSMWLAAPTREDE